MMALTLIRIQALSYRLPGCRPVIFAVIVSNVNVTSRLIEIIEYIAQDSAIRTRLCKTVTTCIV